MALPDPAGYYLQRKCRFLWMFDLIVRSVHSVLEKTFAGENIALLVTETRQEFGRLIPQLPYIGGKHPFTEFLVFTAMLQALYRVSKAHGRTVEQTGELVYEIGRAFIKTSPAFLPRLFTPMNFSGKYLKRLKQQAGESRQREYPEDYIYDFVEGDGKTFDYGADYRECGSCKFLAKHGASELAPYICPVDIPYSEAPGWGLMRSQTLAEGADHCDFRFKKGGATRVAVPAVLQRDISEQV